MDEAKLFELLVALHEGLPRLGPGNAASTRKALSLCRELPPAPDILDVGCGTGAQTLALVAATAGRVLATDLHPRLLVRLRARVRDYGFADRVRTQVADMRALPFRDASFDLLWSEGAIYLMGFDAGVSAWRRLARPGGYLVVSEMSWFRPDPPAALRDYWRANYPEMRTLEDNLAAAATLGWEALAHFRLPPEAWDRDYYAGLRERLPRFREQRRDDPDAQAVADMTEEEMAVMSGAADDCGYAFYILRRAPG